MPAFPILLFCAVFALYAATAAPATLFGDPSEYQFIPAILGIAHPPGYAFYTLLAKLWQTLVPLGTISFRTNLLAAAVGAWAVTAVYLAVYELQVALCSRRTPASASSAGQQSPCTVCRLQVPSFCAALSLAAAPDLWQHAIHANAHIVSAGLAAAHLWLLIRWWRTGRDRWLAVIAFTVGLAATHHPVTLMGLPAYALFVLVVRPRIVRRWRTLLLLAGCLLLGLSPLLYYPLRSPSAPFGPNDMRTWEGLLGHVTARGLRVNLFHFGLADQPDRALVFWSLLRLQFPLPVIAIIALGLVWFARGAPKPAILVYSFLLTHLLFTLNTVQDVMAYLMLPFVALSIVIGVGVLGLSTLVARVYWPLALARSAVADSRFLRLGAGVLGSVAGRLLCVVFLLAWPFYQAARNLQRGISLRDFDAAEEWVAAVRKRFDGVGEGAVLLSNWEHLTPLWVHAYTQGEGLAERDVQLVYVSTANPWVESVWAHIEEGPIYLSDYRPVVRNEGFRLIPEGPLYRVLAPPVTEANLGCPGAPDQCPQYPLDVWVDGQIHILGYDLSEKTVSAGESLVLILYQSAPAVVDGIWMPFARLGPLEARWTTDSRLLTPQWLPGEIVVERYELPVSFNLAPGEYPLSLGYADLSGGRPELEFAPGGGAAVEGSGEGSVFSVELGTITVVPYGSERQRGSAIAPPSAVLERALANLDNQIALMGARARTGWQLRRAMWTEPLLAHPGQPVHLTLTWRALASPRDSYTVFIHLTDGAGRYVAGHDYTPLGGACPTYLWFPKWLPGQVLTDPYRLVLPPDLPPGDYWLEAGMYGMTSLTRLPVVDLAGNLAGDRIVLGPVRVE